MPDGTAGTATTGYFDVVALAASAGGLHAFLGLLPGLPADFPAAVVLVQHLDPRHDSLMAEILERATHLAVKQAAAGDRLAPGTIFVAPPGLHLLARPDRSLALAGTDRVHFSRPSADVLFRSIADCYGGRAIGVILTGSGADGAAGIEAIKHGGGRTIAQDRATSEHFSMPAAAIRTGCIDFVLPLGGIAPALRELVTTGGLG